MRWIQLVRPVNLVVIVLTMYGTWYYVLSSNYFQPIVADDIDFLLLVISTVFIAAAGNIINDYFDVKADRINRPEKMILTKHVKKRWAIIIHWLLNGIGFGISVYLSIQYSNLWFAFIHLISINALWFYSLILKRKLLVGNVVIALLTGVVPLLVVCFFKAGNQGWYSFSEFLPESWNTSIDFSLLYLLAVFAVIQNLVREIIKDIPDMEGDAKTKVTSLPMLLGIRPTLYLCILPLLILPVFSIMLPLHTLPLPTLSILNVEQLIPLFASAGMNIACIIIIFTKYSKEKVKTIYSLIKLSLIAGIALCLTVPHFVK